MTMRTTNPGGGPLTAAAAAATLALFATLPSGTHAILPTGAIDVTSPTTGEKYTLLASQAGYGTYPRMTPGKNPLLELMLPPQGDELLCLESQGKANYTDPSYASYANPPAAADGRSSGASPNNNNKGKALLVPRGSCTFERKSLSAQRLGASAIVVYGTPASRYSLNKTILGPNATDAERKAAENTVYTIDDVLWPADKYDYDCSYGRAEVPTSVLSFDPLPYDAASNDPKLTGTAADGNLCALNSDPTATNGKSFEDSCPSRRCLLTGKRSTSTGGSTKGMTVMEACCAWDLHVWLYADPSIPRWVETLRIPAFYVTMEQGAQLLDSFYRAAQDGTSGGNFNNEAQAAVGLTLYARWTPKYNPSAVLIWAMGVFVAWLAAYLSASDYRDLRKDVRRRMVEMAFGTGDGGDGAPSGSAVVPVEQEQQEEGTFHEEDQYRDHSYTQYVVEESEVPRAATPPGSASRVRSRSRSRTPPRDGGGPPPPPHQYQHPPSQGGGQDRAASAAAADNYRHLDSRNSSQDESLELSMSHALGFVVMASCSLTVLFVFKVYNIVKIMYAFGCSGAVTQILFLPLYEKLGRALHIKSRHRIAFDAGAEFGPVSYLDLAAAISGYGLGLAWLIVAFVAVHPETNTFFWVVQDVMGACMCILFLSVIKLNSIKVASVLLIVAFAYDIFFVFVTPLLTKGGKSVMITVATSGGPPKADPSWCEKYPRDADCAGGDPLPMLLTVPRVMDYQGGASLLGLGDIVLPGLLLSFAARFDAAKRLVGMDGGVFPMMMSSGGGGGLCRCLRGGGYLVPVTVAYAIGLLMANAAVYLMQMGQPALLYLVPCCLGTMVFLGWRRNELSELWDSPRVFKTADAMLYGEEEEVEEEGCEDGGTAGVGGSGAEDESAAAAAADEEGGVVAMGNDGAGDSGRGDAPLLPSRKRNKSRGVGNIT